MSRKEGIMGKKKNTPEDDSLGGIGYWASVIGLVALLSLVIINVFGF